MVASVGPSYNVLSLFQKPSGSAAAAAADTTAVDAIIDQIQQMKTDASPARLQGASAATQAWIESSEAGAGETSETSELAAGSVRNANSARADSGGLSTTIYVHDMNTMVSAVREYNRFVSSKETLITNLNKRKESLETLTDPLEKARSSLIIKETEENLRKDEFIFAKMGQDLVDFKSKYLDSGYVVSGDVLSQQDDGTFKIGAFVVANQEGKVYWSHDGGGVAQVYNNAGQLARLVDLYDSTKSVDLENM